MGRPFQTVFMYQQRNCPVRCSGIKKKNKIKSLLLKQKSNQPNFVERFGCFMSVMMFVMRKPQINLN